MPPASSVCNDIALRLESAQDSLDSTLEECAEQFTQAISEEKQMPDDCFDLLKRVLFEKRFHGCEALSSWMINVFLDKEKLSENQKSTLLRLFIDNHRYYSLESVQHSTGDLLARIFGDEVVIESIKRLLSENTREGDYIAQVAAEVLLTRLEANHPFHREVEVLFLTDEERKRNREADRR